MEETSIGQEWKQLQLRKKQGDGHNADMDDSAQYAPYEPKMVARRLEALRTALGMTRAEFADAIGVDRSSYTKIENGTKPLLPYSAYKIYELYGVDMNYIYLGQVRGVPSSLSKALTSFLNAAHA